MAVRPEPMMVGDQRVGHGGAKEVVYERDFTNHLETNSMTTVSGRSINMDSIDMVGDECEWTEKLDNLKKAKSRIGRDNNQHSGWIEPKNVR
jgi:hypothetical protein